ncbi:MAG: hypothetical protein JEZ07_01085 [Phycisphaerae bacterium]|nr:hypothetical protein [Phycisphaerae bacterium]
MGLAIAIIGIIMMASGGIWFLITVFDDSVGWGIGCILLPIVALIYFFMNIRETWRPIVLKMAGVIVWGIGTAMMPVAA